MLGSSPRSGEPARLRFEPPLVDAWQLYDNSSVAGSRAIASTLGGQAMDVADPERLRQLEGRAG